MALSYVGTPTTASMHLQPTLGIIKPTGVQAGDLLLLFIAGDSRISVDPSGFDGPTATSSNLQTVLYARFATGAEPTSYAVAFSTSVTVVAAMIAIRGAATAWYDPPPVPPVYDPGTTGTSAVVPGITLQNPGDWLLGFFGFGETLAPGTFTLPAGFTSRVAQFSSGSAASDLGMIVGDVQSIAAGATGSKTATTTGSANGRYGFITGIVPATSSTGGGGSPVQSYMLPLGLAVELKLGGSWVDISDYVLQRDGVAITGGSQAEGAGTPDPATCTVTLKNQDGRFSPSYASGAYYPNLVRGTQIRVSVAARSSSGQIYNGFRFWGEVPDWPPQSDISGRDVYVQITATGPYRHLVATGGMGSALQRYYGSLTGGYAPIVYWPIEDDRDTGGLMGTALINGAEMNITAGSPKFKAVSNFNGSAPIAVINNSTWDGLTGSFGGGTGNDVFSIPGTHTWTASTTTVDCRVWGAGGGGEKGQEHTGGGGAGGGGEFAEEATLAVTPGQQYTFTVGDGGGPGSWDNGSANGSPSFFPGDAVSVFAHGGQGSQGWAQGGLGGAGSSNTTHHSGGSGGGQPLIFPGPTFVNGGSGGGGSGGTAANGSNGTGATSYTSAAGGAAVANGGKGGNGGTISTDGFAGGAPGGGGGGGWANNYDHSQGGSGAPGQVQLIYTPTSAPPANVVRAIMMVPVHGGNHNAILMRWFTGGSVARVDLSYVRPGSIRMRGYNSGGTQVFDSGASSWNIDGKTVLVSMELTQSGTSVNWRLASIIAGAKNPSGSITGTLASSATGGVSEIIVAPNADVTKTAMGHISLQYAFVNLTTVSSHMDAHKQEMGIDRFVRLLTEQAMQSAVEYSETADHWGFETGTQGWTGTRATLAQSQFAVAGGVWPTAGGFSMAVTATGAAGQWQAGSPPGTSGLNILPGDRVSVAADVYTTSTLNALGMTINWYDGTGALLSSVSTAAEALGPSAGDTLNLAGIAPAATAFFSVVVFDNETSTAGTVFYLDNVRVHPQIGAQTKGEYKHLLDQIQTLDQGIMKEARNLWGLKYRTRIAMINQPVVCTLDYSKGHISPPLQPVIDQKNVKNDITTKNHKGSSVRVQLANGAMSVAEPPGGVGRIKKAVNVVAADDSQILALANQLLMLGTVQDERYPSVTINLARAALPGNSMATIMASVAAVEVGDYIQLVNLPFWYPQQTAKQLVIGYNETINAFEWTINWICAPESPWEITLTSIRRW